MANNHTNNKEAFKNGQCVCIFLIKAKTKSYYTVILTNVVSSFLFDKDTFQY